MYYDVRLSETLNHHVVSCGVSRRCGQLTGVLGGRGGVGRAGKGRSLIKGRGAGKESPGKTGVA